MTSEDKPLITVKMYQREPHRVSASVRLNSAGKAVGYLVDDQVHPAFVIEIGNELYEQVVAGLSRFRKVDPERPNRDDYLFAFIVNTYGANPRVEGYYIPFSEATTCADVCDRLVELFEDGRKHPLEHGNQLEIWDA